MKNIRNYTPEKYQNGTFEKIEEGIYHTANGYSTCLSFEREPELGVDDSPLNIPQYPLEDILDHFLVYVSDFFEELNATSKNICYLEFSSPDIEDIKKLRSLIGKSAYNNNGALEIIG